LTGADEFFTTEDTEEHRGKHLGRSPL